MGPGVSNSSPSTHVDTWVWVWDPCWIFLSYEYLIWLIYLLFSSSLIDNYIKKPFIFKFFDRLLH